MTLIPAEVQRITSYYRIYVTVTVETFTSIIYIRYDIYIIFRHI